MRFSLSLLLFSLFLSFNSISTQTSNTNEEQMEAAINAVKTGGLVILLPTKAKTLAALEETLTNENFTEKSKNQIRRRIDETKNNIKRDQEWIVALFDRYYTAGDTYFIYDTDFKNLKNGLLSGYFLDKNLAISSSIERPENFLIVRKGNPDQSQYTTREALIVYDKNGADLPRPFPSVSPLWGLALSKDQVDFMRYRNAIRKLSSKFLRLQESDK